MKRRRFLQSLALANLISASRGAAIARASGSKRPREIAADLAIIGGGLGGCAAALAALESAKTVVMTEPTDWIGGQLTQQAVPPDEHPWIERFGANSSYRKIRRAIRDYYRAHYPLSAEVRDDEFFNPGNGGVSKLCHEPKVALAVLTAALAPYVSTGQLTVLLENRPIGADLVADRVRATVVQDRQTGDETVLTAPFFLDATELGDLLPLAKVEFVTGFESRSLTGEPRAPETARPDSHQGFTACFAVDHVEGRDFTTDPPEDYPFWRDYLPKLQPAWPGKLLSLRASDPVSLKPRDFAFDPRGAGAGLWVYRRILDHRNFRPGFASGGITLVNWPQNDYWLGNLVGVSEAEADNHVRRAKRLSLSLLHWLRTEVPRADGKQGFPGLRLRADVVGTRDGLAKHPYIRESRRIRAEFLVTENHVGYELRKQMRKSSDLAAEPFADSVGVGSYRIDLHPDTAGSNYIDVSSLPFQIPLGSLIPVRVENLLPACKNLGVSHVANGCYRLHPVEWSIGEAAGALAAFCLDRRIAPRAVRNDPKRLRDFQSFLTARGVEIAWPKLGPR